MEVSLTQKDLDSNLEEQLAFLESSASAFDNGFAGEIKRLAVTVRVLLHDTTKSKSLLTLLGKKGIKFIDTAVPVDEQNLFSHSSLVRIHLGSKESIPFPLLEDGLSLRAENAIRRYFRYGWELGPRGATFCSRS
jgi:hypothetical protein